MNSLVMIDAGIVAELDRTDRSNFLSLFKAVITNDGASVGHLMIERSRSALHQYYYIFIGLSLN